MSTAEDRQLAGRQVFTKVIQSDVKAAYDGTRDLLEPLLAADEGIAAELPDGTRIGTVKRSKPRRAPVVTDPDALLDWVRQYAPEHLVESVNPAYVEYLKSQAKKHGLAVMGDGTVVPGVELREGGPSYLVQPDPAQVQLLRRRFAELIGGGLLELPSGAAGAA